MAYPFFSIIIPIYKVQDYLKQCVDSVIHQTYQNIEIILVDDGSPDRCPSMCDEYGSKDSRIKVIHKANGGLSDARNEGLKIACGEYVIFLDSDDYYFENSFLENIRRAIEEKSLDAVFFRRTKFIDGSCPIKQSRNPYCDNWKKIQGDDLYYQLSINDKIDANASLKATKRELLIDNNLFFRKNIYSEDIEWFCRYAPKVDKIGIIENTSYCYRKRKGSITSSLSARNVKDLYLSIELYATDLKNGCLPTKKKHAILNYLSYQYYIVLGLASNYLNENEYKVFINNCKAYRWLSDYSISRKTIGCKMLLKIFGINYASKLLGIYIKTR